MASSKCAPGPYRKAYFGKEWTDTGMGCGLGQSQIVDALDRPIAGVAGVEPNDGPMYRNGTFSQEFFDGLHATADLLAASWELLAAAEYCIGGLSDEYPQLTLKKRLQAAVRSAKGGAQ